MPFEFERCDIEGLVVVTPKVFGDNRGFFLETYSKKAFAEGGIVAEFIQDNHSKSKRGVLRGLHFQKRKAQGKLVRVTAGRVLDVAVDLRRHSPTFGKWKSVELSAENKKMFYIPEGFAHGFLTLEDNTEFQYKCTDDYAPEYDSGILWNDPDVNIDWKFAEYGLTEADLDFSEKDKKQPTLRQFIESGTVIGK